MKQNKLKFLMSLVMLLSALSAFAYDFMVDGIAYNINGSAATVTFTDNSDYYSNNYNGLTVANIPESVIYNGVTYTVKTIGDFAFASCSSITNVTIPNSVTTIGNYAFSLCSGLTSVNIPNSVTTIGDYAFYYCSGLTSVTIPNSVTTIGEHAFYKCSSLTSVTIPNSVTSIGYATFTGCSGLMSVTIPNSVTSIGNWAFEGCSSLTSVTIPNSVTHIGQGAFDCCSSLTSVTIPNSVTSIESHTFQGCSSLTSVTIPSSVTSISNAMFLSCTSLTSVNIPNSVTSIGERAFQGCSALKSVTIPNSVTSIGIEAFYKCIGLTNVTIPNSVTIIRSEAFYKCTSLKQLQYDAINCEIGSSVFTDVNLSSLLLGEEVEHIPANLPRFSMSGKTLVLPNSVKTIEARAINGNCDAVVIGDNIESIAAGAFSSGISVAYVSSTIPRPCSNGAFANPQILYVPQDCKAKYFMSDGWYEFANIVEGSYTRVTDLTLDMDSATMHKTETLQLNVTLLPVEHSATMPNWWSTNTTVAIVNSTGLITARNEGEVDIYCRVDNKTVVCHISVVKNMVDSIQLNYSDLFIDWDNIVDLTATITPEDASQDVTWTVPVNDNIYARIMGNKLRVMAKRSGTVTVTATSVADPSVSADCVITIQIPDVNGDTSLNIADVTALIDYLLGGDPDSINIGDADVNGDEKINISDVTALINKLLSGN